MKLWKKIYLVTLILFLILINSGIYLVFNVTYQKDITSEQNRAESIFVMMCSSLTRNMEVLEKDEHLGDDEMRILLKTYEKYYSQQEIKIKCWRNNSVILAGINERPNKEMFDAENDIVTVFTKNKIKTVTITKVIKGFGQDYYIYYEQPLKQLTVTWDKLQRVYIIISVLFSVILAVILLVILRRLTKPVSSLSKAVSKMKEGYYINPEHIEINGNDDIAVLGRDFNDMADVISDSIIKIQEESEKKQQFIDNFAHELKNPLTGIYGFAEYVRKSNISEEEKEECMKFIMEESDRMLQLSYTLLNMAKLRGTKLPKTMVAVEDLCHKIKTHIKFKLREKQIDFKEHIYSQQIYGNEILLISLITNLIINGINASKDKGKIELFIREKDNEYVIEVTDEGCGMEADEVKYIMEPFYRIDKARSRENGGTGLGLSLCYQIVKTHKGNITFETEKGVGTKVIVTIAKE